MLTEWNTNQAIELRDFRDEDRESIVAFENHDVPAHRRATVTGWELRDSLRTAEQVFLRRVVGDPAIAYLSVVDRNTTVWKKAGVCDLELFVAHEWRGRGIGSALYAEAVAFARSRGATRMVVGFTIDREDAPAVGFLVRRGFTEMEREQPAYVEVANLDLTPFLPTVARVEASGIRLFTYASAGDTDENRHRLYALTTVLDGDVPHRDEQVNTPAPFEQWLKYEVEHPLFRADLYWIAEKDGAWIGASQLMPRRDGAALKQCLTGVLKEFRGQGIATALKAKSYQAAQHLTYPIITTENHEMNAPMLAVNKKFGFIPEALDVIYCKTLTEEEPNADNTKN